MGLKSRKPEQKWPDNLTANFNPDLLLSLCGNFSSEHLAFHFKSAASQLHFNFRCLETKSARSTFSVLNKIYWRLDKSYPHVNLFQKNLLNNFNREPFNALLVCGTAPISSHTLEQLKSDGTRVALFIADDPWNRNHSSKWFFNSLSKYDLLITPRKSNLEDLRAYTDAQVIYLPFAYNPDSHFEESSLSQNDYEKYECDLMFFGGADEDRLPYIQSIIKAGFKVKLYGGYWNRYSETSSYAQGIVSIDSLRKAVRASKVVLNLVRRANRDGHVMRSFEVPAMKGCMLTEETQEHLEIFGPDTVPFFKTPTELVEKLKALVDSPTLRAHYAHQAHERITQGKNTYADRLITILGALHPSQNINKLKKP